jgi:hypothetical protein
MVSWAPGNYGGDQTSQHHQEPRCQSALPPPACACGPPGLPPAAEVCGATLALHDALLAAARQAAGPALEPTATASPIS